MAKKEVRCNYCDKIHSGKIVRSFFSGTKKFICTECKKDNFIALSSFDKKVNTGLLIFFLGLFLYYLLFEGIVIIPGLIFIFPLVSFIRNRKIERTNIEIRQQNLGN